MISGRGWTRWPAALVLVLAAATGDAQDATPGPAASPSPSPSAAPSPSPSPASFPNGRVTAVVFGDYYFFPDHHDPKFEDQHGFWLRRGFFGYDHAFNERMSARLRMELTSNGLFTGGAVTGVLKDAFFAWRFKGRQQVRIGMQPTLTFESEDGFWGLRHIEKVPTDLYGIDASRDFAILVSGPLGGGLSYGVQIGNDSGQASETDSFKVVRLFGQYERPSGLRVEGAFNYGRRPNGQHRTTAKGLVGYRKAAFRAAAQYLWQERRSGTAAPDTTIGIVSAWGTWEFAPKRAAVFARFDAVSPEVGGEEVGLPNASSIQYLGLADSSPFRGWIAGVDLTKGAIRVSPNVEFFDYDDGALGHDVATRLTFFWTW
jgi:hypothetical protein